MAGQEENDITFLAFEELLRGAGEAEDLQHAVLSIGHGSGRASGSAEHPTLIDCGDPFTAGAKGDGDKRGETDGRSGVPLHNNGSLSKVQGEEQGSLSTSPTPVPGSEAGCDFFNLRLRISLLTDACNLGLPSFPRRQIILSPVFRPFLYLLRLLPYHHQPLVLSRRRYPIYRQSQGTAPLKMSELVILLKKKRR